MTQPETPEEPREVGGIGGATDGATNAVGQGVDAGKKVVKKGNATHLVIDKGGKTVVDLPLTIVVIGAVLAPWLAAAGAIVAVVTGHRMSINNPEGARGDAESATETVVAEGEAIHETAGSAVEQIADEGAPGSQT